MSRRTAFAHLSRTLPRWLWSIVAVLVVLHVAMMVVHNLIAELPCQRRDLFDIEENESIGAMFMVAVAGLGGLLAMFHAGRASGEAPVMRVLWVALGMAVLGVAVQKALMPGGFGDLADESWLVAAAPIVVGVVAVPFLIKLPAPTRRRLAVAGAVYLAGAIGVDAATDLIPGPAGKDPCGGDVRTLGYGLASALESALEMSGVLLFLFAMIDVVGADFAADKSRR